MKEFNFLINIFTHLVLPAVVILTFFTTVKLFYRRFWRRRFLKSKLEKFLPIIEIVVWLIFASWVVIYFLNNPTWRAIFLLTLCAALLIIISWVAMKDIFAGIILRVDNSFNLNEWIKVQDIDGKIVKLGYRTFELETGTGEMVSIPYSRVSGEIRTRPSVSEKVKSHSFAVNLPKIDPIDKTAKKLKFTLANAPWSSLKKLPTVKFIKETPDRYQFEIIIYSMKVSYFQHIKKVLSEIFSDIRMVEPGNT
ncbi:MAG: mechanosensitive ion channel family protein [Cytophagales bacterium]|nr:mechanosensitive ion channel family protein [Cytophagales bacterium]